MLLDLKDLIFKHHMNISGILHVGAHDCEELQLYIKNGVSKNKIIWIEANPNLVSKNKMKDSNIKILNYLVSDVHGQDSQLNVTNNSQSSSMLNLGEHKNIYNWIHYIKKIPMKTARLDKIYKIHDIDPNFANFLNFDIQGAELLALKGMGDLINNFKYLYLEINIEHLYENCCLVYEIDDYVRQFGFVRVDTKLFEDHKWGDALYIKIV